MTRITCARPSQPRARSPSSPTTPREPSNIRSTNISMPSAISWNAASASSSSSVASQPASKKPPEITAPSSLSLPSSYGCDKCPHCLELVESALGCSLSVFECLRFAMRDQFLVARWAEQFPANDGAAGAIGRKIEHHQFVIANASALGVVGADELRVCLPGDFVHGGLLVADDDHGDGDQNCDGD